MKDRDKRTINKKSVVRAAIRYLRYLRGRIETVPEDKEKVIAQAMGLVHFLETMDIFSCQNTKVLYGIITGWNETSKQV